MSPAFSSFFLVARAARPRTKLAAIKSGDCWWTVPGLPRVDVFRYQRRLPHWRSKGSTYFVTWRLYPGQQDLTAEERSLTSSCLDHFGNQRYRLLGYVVMNDHVHVAVEPFSGHRLTAIVRGGNRLLLTTSNRCPDGSGASGRTNHSIGSSVTNANWWRSLHTSRVTRRNVGRRFATIRGCGSLSRSDKPNPQARWQPALSAGGPPAPLRKRAARSLIQKTLVCRPM